MLRHILLLILVIIGSTSITASEFTDAIKEKNLPKVKELLSNRSVPQKDLDQAFLDSFFKNETEYANLFLESGANINAKQGGALIKSILMGRADYVKTLIDRGADVNIKDSTQSTPLIQAVIKGNADIVRLLLKNNADVTATDKAGKTALSHAIKKGNPEIKNLISGTGAALTFEQALELGGGLNI